MCSHHWKKLFPSLKKIDDIQNLFPNIKLDWNFSWSIENSVGLSCNVNKPKIVPLELITLYIQLSGTVFFVNKCC